MRPFGNPGACLRFHLVDSIIAWHPRERAVGIKALARADAFMADQPALPRTLLIEALAQLSSFLLGDAEARDGRHVLSLMTSVDRLTWHADLYPGERARLEARITSRRPEGARLLVRVDVEGLTPARPLAEGQLGFVFFPAASEAQQREFAWTHELLVTLAAGCREGEAPRPEVFA